MRSCPPTLESTAATGAPSSVEWTFPRKSWSRGLFQGTHFYPTTTSPFALVKPTPQSDTGAQAEALAVEGGIVPFFGPLPLGMLMSSACDGFRLAYDRQEWAGSR
jgi:hypothetical protein